MKPNDVPLDELVSTHPTRSARLVPHLRSGEPRDEIPATAREIGADLVCMGTHGRRGLRRLILGSVAAEVLARSPVPVLVAR